MTTSEIPVWILMIIYNMESILISKNKLSTAESKILSLLNKAILLSRPQDIMKKHLKKLSDKNFSIDDEVVEISGGRLYVLGWGKLAGAMAEGVESILGEEMIAYGAVICNNADYNLRKIRLLEGTHPFPSQKNVDSTKKIVSLAKKFEKNDYALCLISGGGSSLLFLPAHGIPLNEKIEAVKIMMLSGLSVQEMNIVRKHLSDIKGGKLSKYIQPARIINIIISDDVDDNVYSIASGATLPDPTTYKDALSIIKKYQLEKELPSSVTGHIKTNINAKNEKKPIQCQDNLSGIKSFIIFNNKSFLEIVKKTAQQTGFENVEIYQKTLKGNINNAISEFCSFVSDTKRKYKNREFLAIAGGEAEVKEAHRGRGGRAQHFAALMIPKLEEFQNSSFIAIASDGKDYIEGIAGALVNNKTMDFIRKEKIDYDSYISHVETFNLHKLLNTHLFSTKNTEVNVFDIYIFANIPKNKVIV